MGFRNPPVAGEELTFPGIRSANYVEGVAGWRLARDGDAQVDTLQVLDSLGVNGPMTADKVSAGPGGLWLPDQSEVGARLDAIEAGGVVLPDVLPGQIIKGGYFNASQVTASNSSGPNAEMGLFALDTGAIPVSGWYSLEVSPVVLSNDGTGAEVSTVFRYTSTTDGTTPAAPSISSALLGYGSYAVDGAGYLANSVQLHRYLTAGTRLRILYTYRGTTGTTTLYPSQTISAALVYRGAMASSAFAGGSANGLSLSAGGGTEPPPEVPAPTPVPKSYTKTYQPTWSRSYEGSNATRYDDSPYCFQGYYSSSNGNQRSLVGFNYAAIAADLAGASNVTLKLTFTVAHTYNNNQTGFTVQIGGHTYAAKPATWADASVAQSQTSRASSIAGNTYTVTLPASFVTNFKSQAWKGIAFGPGPSTSQTHYGYLFGATQTGKPYLTATYTK